MHLSNAPAQPYAWLDSWPPAIAGALLRDVPEEALDAARPAVRRLAGALGADEPLLALAAAGEAVAAVTPERLLIADAHAVEALPPSGAPPDGLAERVPGRLAATLELVGAVVALRRP